MGLVGHDVPVGPVPVRGGAFDEFTGVALKEPVGQVLAADFEDVQQAGGVLGLGLPFLLGGLVGRLVATQQVDQFVEQRHVRHRPGGAVGARQRRVRTGRPQPGDRAG